MIGEYWLIMVKQSKKQKRRNLKSSYPSTSSGRTEKELSAAFTAEPAEAPGRTALFMSSKYKITF